MEHQNTTWDRPVITERRRKRGEEAPRWYLSLAQWVCNTDAERVRQEWDAGETGNSRHRSETLVKPAHTLQHWSHRTGSYQRVV